MPEVPVGLDADTLDPTYGGVLVMADIEDDVMSMHVENVLKTQEMLMAESQGNVQGANSIVRYSAARKYNQEDPIEAACAEMILQLS
jgi:hypothetical protein